MEEEVGRKWTAAGEATPESLAPRTRSSPAREVPDRRSEDVSHRATSSSSRRRHGPARHDLRRRGLRAALRTRRTSIRSLPTRVPDRAEERRRLRGGASGHEDLVGGVVSSQGGQSGAYGLARYSADGVLDTTFGTNGQASVRFGSLVGGAAFQTRSARRRGCTMAVSSRAPVAEPTTPRLRPRAL